MRTVYEQQILEASLRIYNYHHNAVWAYETLEYLIFIEHAKEFYQLTEGKSRVIHKKSEIIQTFLHAWK